MWRVSKVSPVVGLVIGSCVLGACEDDSGTKPADVTDATDTRADAASDTNGSDTVQSSAPTLNEVKAHMSGARGLDLQLTVLGEDTDKDIERLEVRLFDAGGEPVVAFRSGLSDVPDSNETTIGFDVPGDVAQKASILATATLRGIFADFAPAAVEVVLVDATGQKSDALKVDVGVQEVKNLGDACDSLFVTSRCAPGLGCRDGQCQEGLPPEITKVAYLNGAGGTRIVVEGTEPEDDIETLKIEFLDNQGNPVEIDLDNDDTPESQSFEVAAENTSRDGVFRILVTPTAEFAAMVQNIGVTATDAAGHEGARKTAKLTASPVRSAGQGCSLYGFDACNTKSVCVPVPSGESGICKDVIAQRKAECAAAQPLPVDGSTVVGFASGPSLFDAPALCSASDPVGRPEGVYRLVLEAPVSKLTISTDHPETNFDTVVYVVPACGETDAAPLGCADETGLQSAAGTLELSLVPAGEYLVIVDSWGPDGGQFGVSAASE
jgi:hypothetical protein